MKKRKTDAVVNNAISAGTESELENSRKIETNITEPAVDKPKPKRGRPRKKPADNENNNTAGEIMLRENNKTVSIPETKAENPPVLPEPDIKPVADMPTAPTQLTAEKAVQLTLNLESTEAPAVNTGGQHKQNRHQNNNAPAGQGKKQKQKNNKYRHFDHRKFKKKNAANGKTNSGNTQQQNRKPKIDNDPYRRGNDFQNKNSKDQNQNKPHAKNAQAPKGPKKRHQHNPQYGGTLENQHPVIAGASNKYKRSMNYRRKNQNQGYNTAPPRKKSTASDSNYGSSYQQEVYTHYDERSVFGGNSSAKRTIKSETKQRWNEKFGGRRKGRSDGRDKSK